MNPSKRLTLSLLIVALVASFLVACGPAASAVAEENADVAEATAEVSAAVDAPGAQNEAPAAQNERAAAPVVSSQKAELTVIEGTVTLMRSGQTNFRTVNRTAQMRVGDIVRTTADGVAVVKFADNTEATLFPNSQLQIKVFDQLESGALSITLQQFVGRIFHRANFTADGSSYDVETTNAVAMVQGTAFYVDVVFVDADGEDPEGAAEYIEEIEFFQKSYGSEPELLNELGEIRALFDIASGVVKVIYLENSEQKSVTLEPGQTATIIRIGDIDSWTAIDEDTSILNTGLEGQIIIGVTDRNCGDLVCDSYLGETAATCAVDCTP